MSSNESTVASSEHGDTSDNSAPTGESEPATDVERSREDLVTELELLREENRRLHDSYVRAQRSTYRRTAFGFLAIGVLAIGGGVLFSDLRTVLFAFGGTGIFAALLTYLITPEQFISGTVGGTVYKQLSTTLSTMAGELGLESERVYVPRDSDDVRLYIPQRAGYDVPSADALDSVFVVGADESTRGISVHPTGEGLFREFERARQGPAPDDPGDIFAGLREAVVEQFELANALDVEIDSDDGRLSLRASDPTHGDLASFDHPIVSFIACGLAHGLTRPIRIEQPMDGGDETTDAKGELVTLRWSVETLSEDAGDENQT